MPLYALMSMAFEKMHTRNVPSRVLMFLALWRLTWLGAAWADYQAWDNGHASHEL
jgi:hypothetical protein